MQIKHWQTAIGGRFQPQLRHGNFRSDELLPATAEFLPLWEAPAEPPVSHPGMQHSLLEGSPTLHHSHKQHPKPPTELHNKWQICDWKATYGEKERRNSICKWDTKIEEEQCRNPSITRNQGSKPGRDTGENYKQEKSNERCVMYSGEKTTRAVLKLQNCVLYILKYRVKKLK